LLHLIYECVLPTGIYGFIDALPDLKNTVTIASGKCGPHVLKCKQSVGPLDAGDNPFNGIQN
jgi:hypothetical protein